jgi:MYXO-CTERM domain-containing protein
MNLVTGAFVVFAVSCANNTFRSERDQANVRLEDLEVAVREPANPAWPVLAGAVSRISVRDPSCLRPRASGAARYWDGVVTFDAPGEARIDLIAATCDPALGVVDDGLTLTVVDAADVTPRFVRPWELEGLRDLDAGLAAPVGDVASIRPAVPHAPGEPIRILEGVRTELTVALAHGDGWAFTSEGLSWARVDGAGFEVHDNHPLSVDVTGRAGAAGTLRWGVVGAPIDVAPVLAVPAEDAASLQIGGLVGATAQGPVVNLTAVVRDAEGRRIDGVPVAWEVDPAEVLAFAEPEETYFVGVVGLCVPNARRETTFPFRVAASFGALRDEVVGEALLEKLDLTRQERREFRTYRREACPRCGCAAAPTPAGLGGAALVVAAIWGGRRRRRG